MDFTFRNLITPPPHSFFHIVDYYGIAGSDGSATKHISRSQLNPALNLFRSCSVNTRSSGPRRGVWSRWICLRCVCCHVCVYVEPPYVEPASSLPVQIHSQFSHGR